MSEAKELIAQQSQDVIDQVLQEASAERSRDLVALFNLHQTKRSMVRVQRMSGLWDTITGLIEQRFQERPDQFSNDQLLDYLKAVQDAIDKASKGAEKVEDLPAITFNFNQQNNLNVQADETPRIDRASQLRIEQAVQAVLARAASTENRSKTIYDTEENNNANED